MKEKNNMSSRSQALLDYSIVAMVAGMFLSTVSSTKIPSILFYVLCAACVLNWYVNYKKGTSTEGIELRQHRTLFILCSVSLIAVLVSKTVHLNLSGTEIEKAVRFSVGLPLLYAGMRFIPYERLKHALWGVYAAILFQFVFVLNSLGPNFTRPNTSDIHNAVSYGVILLLFVFIIAYSFSQRFTNFLLTERVFKTLLILIGLVGFVLLETRTGFVALPVFVLLMVLVYFRKENILKMSLVYFLGLVLVAGVAFMIPVINKKVDLAVNEFSACLEKEVLVDSSVCVRMQLSRASYEIWKESPWFGTGDNSAFQAIMKEEFVTKNIVTKYTADNFGEPHNDYMQHLSSFGILGLIGLMFLYWAPGCVFLISLLKTGELKVRSIAAMGATVSLGFSIFSLTELMFRNMRTVSFYATSIAFTLVLLTLLSDKHSVKK